METLIRLRARRQDPLLLIRRRAPSSETGGVALKLVALERVEDDAELRAADAAADQPEAPP
jgi:hypothetical protein